MRITDKPLRTGSPAERGHGFGTLGKGTTSEGWLDSYLTWLSLQ